MINLEEQKLKHKNKIEFLKKLGIETDLEGRIRIDQSVMKKLRPIPEGNRYRSLIISDTQLMGFRAKVSPGGTKSFIYRYRPKGSQDNAAIEKQIITIGNWYDNSDLKDRDKISMTPTVARTIAKDMVIKIAKKEDPYSIIQTRRRSRSLMSVYTDWIKKRVPSANYKESSKKDYNGRYKLYGCQQSKKEIYRKFYRQEANAFKIFNMEFKKITKDDYISLHNSLTKKSKSQANRMIEDLRLVEKYAIEIGVLDKRVCIFSKKELNYEPSRLERENPYDRDEIKRYRRSALELIKEDLKLNQFNRFVSCCLLIALCILGGRSKSMVNCIKWNQIDRKNKVIKFSNTKNNKPIELDFDYRFSAILRLMDRYRNKMKIHKNDKRYQYVFPTLSKNTKTKFIADARRTHKSIIERAKLPFKCIHFLRHAWATNTYEATKDILAVKEMGGWQSLEAVQKYTLVSRETRRQRLAQTRAYMNRSTI
jgi:hypothetical protein